ncbi:DUF3576 domain-containing protein [Pelagibacteraceae bacterium]|nr:DUF3576 domain-containing protein [Pelagibacteraceae bacterium]
MISKIISNPYKLTKFSIQLSILLIVSNMLFSCGIYKPVDARKVPVIGKERAKKNVEEGRGIKLRDAMGSSNATTYQFSTSNPMWRSSLEILEFLPLSVVDYSGGIIVSDWYSDSSKNNDSIKITVRFLSNNIQSNSIKVIVHSKACSVNDVCVVKKINSTIANELKSSILRKATKLSKTSRVKK